MNLVSRMDYQVCYLSLFHLTKQYAEAKHLARNMYDNYCCNSRSVRGNKVVIAKVMGSWGHKDIFTLRKGKSYHSCSSCQVRNSYL